MFFYVLEDHLLGGGGVAPENGFRLRNRCREVFLMRGLTSTNF